MTPKQYMAYTRILVDRHYNDGKSITIHPDDLCKLTAYFTNILATYNCKPTGKPLTLFGVPVKCFWKADKYTH